MTHSHRRSVTMFDSHVRMMAVACTSEGRLFRGAAPYDPALPKTPPGYHCRPGGRTNRTFKVTVCSDGDHAAR